MNNKDLNNFFNSSYFLKLIYKWRFHLLIITIITIILSWFFSSPLFITPKYKATVVMFPVATNSLSKAILVSNSPSKKDVMEFGEEEQAEQLLQILYSNEIRNRITKKFNLMSHYDIDSNSNYKTTYLYNAYKDNITFKRNQFTAVEINVLDKDPQVAADIANTIANLVDTVKSKIQKERAIYALRIIENNLNDIQKELKQMDDSLDVLRSLGVNSYDYQTQMLTRQLAVEVARNNKTGVKALEEQLNVLSKYGGAYTALKDKANHMRDLQATFKEKYIEAKIDADQTIPQKFVVNYAYKAEKKSYPIRWIILSVSTISVLILSFVFILFFEKFLLKNENTNVVS